jgi:hypothetical protein
MGSERKRNNTYGAEAGRERKVGPLHAMRDCIASLCSDSLLTSPSASHQYRGTEPVCRNPIRNLAAWGVSPLHIMYYGDVAESLHAD